MVERRRISSASVFARVFGEKLSESRVDSLLVRKRRGNVRIEPEEVGGGVCVGGQRALMIRTHSSRAPCTTTSNYPDADVPIVTNRSSSSE